MNPITLARIILTATLAWSVALGFLALRWELTVVTSLLLATSIGLSWTRRRTTSVTIGQIGLVLTFLWSMLLLIGDRDIPDQIVPDNPLWWLAAGVILVFLALRLVQAISSERANSPPNHVGNDARS
jgi:4-hydroxybenzoate polyprenyltransferase